MSPAHEGERVQQLWDAFARVHVAEATEDRPSLDPRDVHIRHGPGGMCNSPDRTFVAAPAHAFLNVVGVHDHTARPCEDFVDERKLVRPCLPERQHAPFKDTVR